MKNVIKLLVILILSLVICLTACNKVTMDRDDTPEIVDLTFDLQFLIDSHTIPAMVSLAIADSKIVAEGAAGVRKYEETTPVTINDEFMLSSCTQSFTATLIAILVEQDMLNWETTLAEFFPELADQMLPRYRDVNLLHLLSHHAGFPEAQTGGSFDPLTQTIDKWKNSTASIMEQRYEFTKYVLCQPLSPEIDNLPEPGSTFLFSSVGYAIVGTMAENVTGRSWEELITEFIFEPLKMNSAGFFYNQGTINNGDNPWQHEMNNLLQPVPISYSYERFPNIMGPGGSIQMSITDWAKFVIDHIKSKDGESLLLKAETYKFLHSPPFGTEFALGWYITEATPRNSGYSHQGSHGFNYAAVWMSPEDNCAVLAAMNIISREQIMAVQAFTFNLLKNTLNDEY